MTNEHPAACREGFSVLSLRDIASWQCKSIAEKTTLPIVAEIPSLQRGAVWDAGQVELLWDSIMRGFPIGSLVVCKKQESQIKRIGENGSGWLENEINYHLLDGQQRCNAISLGFLNPYASELHKSKNRAYLWIDIQPCKPAIGSTRQFLFRVLTTAHPWGYQRNDNATPLGVEAIRKALKKYGIEENDRNVRPSVDAAWPQESDIPIPFAWLLDAVINRNLNGKALWKDILLKCKAFDGKKWADAAADLISRYLEENCDNKHFALIEKGLGYAKSLSIVALKVPPEILEAGSIQEQQGDQVVPDADVRISTIEHLFQRLNSGGTELRGEELAFSMIKAYWPRIEDSFDAIKDKNGNRQQPMAGSHLAMLGARAALIGYGKNEGKNKLPAPLSISRIRTISYNPVAKDEKAQLERYFGIASDQFDFYVTDLHLNLRQIDQWLLNDGSECDIGLPPVLRTSLAQNAPDVFLLLLHLAQKVRDDNLSQEQIIALRKPVLGLSTALHWFGDDRARAAEFIYGKNFCGDKLSPETFANTLQCCQELPGNRRGIFKLITPNELANLIPQPTPTDQKLKDWNFWNLIVENSDARADSEKHVWPFLERLMKSKNLLLYAQRDFMCSRFEDYDPSRTDTWRESNRPWDYDHILPAATLYNKRGKQLKKACDQWVNKIGNLRAWPLEENRSRSNEIALNSIDIVDYENSFLHDEEECKAFSMSESNIDDPEKAAAFMNAARNRMIRIYKNWFETLEIGKLL